MNVLICNNRVRGGSGTDAVVDLEVSCLRALGHPVETFERSNADFTAADRRARARACSDVLCPGLRARRFRRVVSSFHPDVIHVHNTFPLLNGTVYAAARRAPAVVTLQSLHNYRAVCPQSYAFRSGHPCVDCRGRAFVPCAVHRCYRGSLPASVLAVAMRWLESARGRPFACDADLFLAVSECVRRFHLELGMPAERVLVLPNAGVDLTAVAGLDPKAMPTAARKLVYVGAMTTAKGIAHLPALASALPEFEVHAVGGGPGTGMLGAEARRHGLGNLILHGYLPQARAAEVWKDALLTLVPSVWDEPFGLAAVESFSLGIPVVTTGRGGLADIVTDGVTGMVDDFADPTVLAARIRAQAADAARYAAMRAASRRAYEARFSASAYRASLQALMEGPVDDARRRAISEAP